MTRSNEGPALSRRAGPIDQVGGPPGATVVVGAAVTPVGATRGAVVVVLPVPEGATLFGMVVGGTVVVVAAATVVVGGTVVAGTVVVVVAGSVVTGTNVVVAGTVVAGAATVVVTAGAVVVVGGMMIALGMLAIFITNVIGTMTSWLVPMVTFIEVLPAVRLPVSVWMSTA